MKHTGTDRSPRSCRVSVVFAGATFALAVACPAIVLASTPGEEPPARPRPSEGRLWHPVAEDELTPILAQHIAPGRYHTLRVDHGELVNLLARAPLEQTGEARDAQVVMELPWPDGSLRRFRIEKSPTMAPELAAQFPELETYRGQGIDDRTAVARLDWTLSGFHAMALSGEGTVYVDPFSPGDTQNYIVYFARDHSRAGAEPFRCGVTTEELAGGLEHPTDPRLQPPHGATLRTYRLAVAATGEYTTAHGGTVAGAMNGIVTTVNRVNLIFERDLAVRLSLVANNAAIVYTDPAADPYTNTSAEAMQCENPLVLDTVIGDGNYDIGHVFAAGEGGFAAVGVVCRDTTNCPAPSGSDKARGASGLPVPAGDFFDMRVAHEVGHQFSATHTFNGTTDACGPVRVASTAFEPGAGSTIESYAGGCGSESFQTTRDFYFHAGSQDQMIAFINTGGSCRPPISTGNTPPSVSAGPDYTIPQSTPFTLTAVGSDANGDYLSYTWEEMDLGTASGPPPLDPPNIDDGSRPLFRSFLPTASPSRTFPKLSDILNPPATWQGEVLPTTTRSMNFRVTARDNRLGGGGTNSDDMVLNVRADSGPFGVTQPNNAVTWPIGSTQTVTWNVANTTAAPVNCANVRISLSTDGGNTFPTVLAGSTPNDGSETITIPSYPTTLARIKVEAVGNIFFDVSDVNFTINTPGSSLSIDDVTVAERNSGTTAIFTVTLSPTSASTVTVAYQTANGTATAGSDYVSTSAILTFAPGESTKTISVVVTGDTLGEANETFFVNLSGATNATISDGQGVGTITNDDCGSISGVADGSFEAGSPWPAWTAQGSTTRGTPLCNATLGGCGAAITPYAGDYVAMFGAVSAAETATLGQTVVLPLSTSLTLRFQMRIRTVSVSPADTLVVRVDGIAVRTFAEPTSPDSGYLPREVDLTPFADGGSHAVLFTYTNVAPTSAYAIFLVDNVELFSCPPPGVVSTCVADGTFEAGSPWPAWTVQTSTGYGTPLCTPALCGTGASPFAGGNWAWFGGAAAPETATLGQAVVLPLFSNPLLRFQMRVEMTAPPTDTLVVSVDGTPVQTFVEPASSESEYSVRQIDLTPFANGGSHALLFTYTGPTSGVGNFHVDNVQLLCLPAPPSISIDDVVVAEGDLPGITMAKFTVSLSAPSAQTVTVAYASASGTTAAGSDYVAASGTVTFAPGTTTQPIAVTVIGDSLDEPNETFFVNLSSATNASISDGQGLATVIDDDLPPTLSIDDVAANENTTATFTVTLSAASGQQVTVAYLTVDGTAVAGSDYIATSGALVFAPGVTTRSIMVSVNGDTTDESDEVFFVNVGSPVNATITDGQGVGTVVNRPDLIFKDGFQ